MQHDRYEMDILKALQRIANSLDKIEKKMPDKPMSINDQRETIGLPRIEEYDTVEYGKTHPDWVGKVNKIANGNKKDFNELSCSSLNHIAAAFDGTCVDICDMKCPYENKED